MSALIYRHNRITRFTHWINALALLILFMSGLQIFNAYPNLHWGSKAEPDEAFFSIYAMEENGQVRGYTEFYGLRAETTGWLGIQNTDMGPAPRAFPSWLTIPGYFWLAGGRRWHFFFAWVFVLNGLLYFLYNVVTGHVRKFVLSPPDTKKIFPMILYYLRLRRESPQEGEYNPLQKMAYTGVFFILTPLIILSGMAMSPQLDVAFNWLPAMFGGRQSARTIHFMLTFLFVLFTFGHIFMVITTDVLNNMRSMTTGWYVEKIPADLQVATEAAITEPSPPTIAPTPTPSLEGEGKGEEEAVEPMATPADQVAEKPDSKTQVAPKIPTVETDQATPTPTKSAAAEAVEQSEREKSADEKK
jgi:Ni/Fe-hydrogenase b-type cytochrome subunit